MLATEEMSPATGSAAIATPASGPIVDCFGAPIRNWRWDEFLAWFQGHQRTSDPGPCQKMFIVNAHTMNLAWRSPQFADVLRHGDLVLNDGVGLSLYGRIVGQPIRYNFVGTDLFPRLFAEWPLDARPLRVFFYGARPGRAEQAAGHVATRYPGVEVAGWAHGYEPDSAQVIARINESAADLLLVALGNPRQEQWIDAHAAELNVRIACGVGALLDFLSGQVPRAPLWMRNLRMEWVYRLLHEPRRLFRRYVIGNPLFILRSFYYKATRARRFGRHAVVQPTHR